MDAPRPERMSAPGKTEPLVAIARARTGDADAWGVLYQEYAAAIFRFCRRALPTREDAEDATMDIFAKLMRDNRLLQYDQSRSFTAWLYKVAKNKTIDYIRSCRHKNKIQTELQDELKSEWGMSSKVNQLFRDEEIQDSVLRMMFVCCHPSIPAESQIALTLKTLGGLTSLEIAHAFLTSEDTIAKRIYRAKEKIKEEQLNFASHG